MHSSKIRPTLLPERGRRETATIPPTANPIPNAGERAGKKQLSMQSDIQITNRNDTCFVDIEGVIGVPEEWQFDQPSSRVATYEKFRDSLDRLREIDAPEIVVNIRSVSYTHLIRPARLHVLQRGGNGTVWSRSWSRPWC